MKEEKEIMLPNQKKIKLISKPITDPPTMTPGEFAKMVDREKSQILNAIAKSQLNFGRLPKDKGNTSKKPMLVIMDDLAKSYQKNHCTRESSRRSKMHKPDNNQ